MRKIFLVLISVLVFGCTPKFEYNNITGFAQGTTYSITYCDNGVGNLKPFVDSVLLQFDSVLSNYNESSQLSLLNRGDSVELHDWFVECFEESMVVFDASDGLFDPTLRPLINAYGFGAKGQKEFVTLDSLQVVEVLKNVGLNKVKLNGKKLLLPQGMSLDFSAIAQGQSVDILAKEFEKMGVSDYIVEVGGEIYAKGKNGRGVTWRVGIDTPIEGNFIPGQSIAYEVELDGKGLATSGNYRKFFEVDGKKYSHAINPKNGLCTRDSLLSATIIAPNAALADGYATACMVGGYVWSQDFLKRKNILGYLIYQNHKGEIVTQKVVPSTSL